METAVPIEVDPAQYDSQLAKKVQQLQQLFAATATAGDGGLALPDEIKIHRSQPINYRMRAQFAVYHSGDEMHYVMFRPAVPPPAETASTSDHVTSAGGASTSAVKPSDRRPPIVRKGGGAKRSSQRVRLERFPVGSLLMNELMPLVLDGCRASPVLRQRLFQVNYQTTLSGEAMVTLIYHCALGDEWREAAGKLRQQLAEACLGGDVNKLHVIGRSRGQLVELDRAYVVEELTVNGQQYTYRQVEGAFSQPNAGVCQQMLAWAQDVTRPQAGAAPVNDLLELYCGNGNFTVPLAANFRRVVATEVSKSSVDAARHNLEANGVGNVFLARMASDEFAETWRTKGTRNRLKGLSWDEVDFSTILVDPPRAGLDDFTVELVRDFACVLYISCNPETLRANLLALHDTHELTRFAVFDQFPYSHHLECGAYLVRRT